MSNILSKTVSIIKNWWIFILIGVLLIVASFYVINTPEESYPILAQLFSFLVLFNGFLSIYFAISNRKGLDGWGWYLAGGVLEVVLGGVLIYYPELSLITLPLFVGFWFLFRGISIMGTSFELKNYGIMEWGYLLLLGFVLTMAASFILMTPILGAINVVFVTSLGLFIFGIAQIIIGFKLKKIKNKTVDKFERVKKTVKDNINNLRASIVQGFQNVTAEGKNSIDEAFKNYESKI